MAFYLHRDTSLHTWRVVTERPAEGEVIELPSVEWFSQAQAEADRRNGKGDGGQGVLGL